MALNFKLQPPSWDNALIQYFEYSDWIEGRLLILKVENGKLLLVKKLENLGSKNFF